MAAPVIALRRGAAPEVIVDGETGFLCEDEDEMVAAVRKLSSVGSLSVCRRHVEDHFSVEEMARQYVEVYKRILAS